MSDYKVELVRSAVKEYQVLPVAIQKKVAEVIDLLPNYTHTKKLQGYNSLFRARVGNYRVIFERSDARKLIIVTHIRHRQNAYGN